MTSKLVVERPTVTAPRQRGLVSAASMIISRMAFAMGLGLGFSGARDYYSVFGYNRDPKHTDFVGKYLRQDIAGRIIDQPVNALWTDPPVLDGGARFNKAWETLVYDRDLYTHIARADIFAGLGNYAILMIGLDDGRQLDQPVNTGRANKVLFFQPYLQASVEIEKLEDNPTNPRFGLPVLYKVTPGSAILVKNSSALANKVPNSFQLHWTRCLHLADRTLESVVYGHSRLEPVYNALDDLLKVTGGSAETFWLTANRGMQVDVDKDMELEEEDAAALEEEIDEYSQGLRRVLRTRGVKVENLGSDVADPRGVFNAIVALIASNTGIPQRVLMGAEAGQLASQQDRANWAVMVGQRQKNWGWPVVLRPIIQQLQLIGVLPDNAKNIVCGWPEPFKMNPLERGQTSAQQARSITNVSRAMETAQKIGVELISVEEAREITAPGPQLLVLGPKPNGPATYPPKLSAPYNDPQNKLDEIEAQAEATAKAFADNPVARQPFGGGSNDGGNNAA